MRFVSFYGYQGFGGGSVPSLFRSLCNRANTQSILDQVLQRYPKCLRHNYKLSLFTLIFNS